MGDTPTHMEKELAYQKLYRDESPGFIYTSFALGIVREFLAIAATAQPIEEHASLQWQEQIERSFLGCVNIIPSEKQREEVLAKYRELRDKQGSANAAIISMSKITSYLTKELGLTQSQYVGII